MMMSLRAGHRLSCNLGAIDAADYVSLGRLVAVTILQGGPGLPVFEPPVAEYILTGRVLSLEAHYFPQDRRSVVQEVSFV